MKVLVVYFSRKGYVEKIAKKIAKEKSAEVYSIKTTERTQGILGFWWCGRFGMNRMEMPIEPITVPLEKYDKVIVCSPIWVFTVAAPIRTFLHQAHGRIRSVDYVLVHFSSPKKYNKTIQVMDRLVGVSHQGVSSISCMWGHVFE